MIYVFERDTTEQLRVRADDEESARKKAEELSEIEWVIVNAPEMELIATEQD